MGQFNGGIETMKYIRTKEGVFKLENTYVYKGKTYYGMEIVSTFTEEEIIAQADTIEELCDEFVIDYKEENPLQRPYVVYTLVKPQMPKLAKLKQERPFINIYGAIWTAKGLIYVAKMNEKGELELL